MPPDIFYLCLSDYTTSDDMGIWLKKTQIRTIDDESPLITKIIAFRNTIAVGRIESASIHGVAYLRDIQRILDDYGPPGMFSY